MLGTERHDLAGQLQRLNPVLDRETVDGGLARRDPFLVADREGVVVEHVQGDDRVVVEAVAFAVLKPAKGHVAGHRVVVVVLLHVRHDGRARELPVEPLGHGALSALISAAVAYEDDVAKAVHLQAVGDIGQQRFEGFLAQAEGTGAGHVAAGRVDVAFGHQLDDRSAEGVAQLAGDGVTVGAQHVVVLAGGEPGAVGFDTARGDDGRGLAVRQGVADVHPRHLLDPDRVRGGKRVRGVPAVVDVGRAVAASHAVRVALRTLLSRDTGRCEEQGSDEQGGLHGVSSGFR